MERLTRKRLAALRQVRLWMERFFDKGVAALHREVPAGVENVECPGASAEMFRHVALVGQPVAEGNREAALFPLEDGRGERLFGGGGQQFLAVSSCHRNDRGGDLAKEEGIDERHPYLQRMSHRRPVDVAQELTSQKKRRLQRRDACER